MIYSYCSDSLFFFDSHGVDVGGDGKAYCNGSHFGLALIHRHFENDDDEDESGRSLRHNGLPRGRLERNDVDTAEGTGVCW